MAERAPRSGRVPGETQAERASKPEGNPSGKGICPTCQGPLETTAHGPFCSERCRLLDLSRWLEGDYRISTDPREPSLDAIPDEGDREDRG